MPFKLLVFAFIVTSQTQNTSLRHDDIQSSDNSNDNHNSLSKRWWWTSWEEKCISGDRVWLNTNINNRFGDRHQTCMEYAIDKNNIAIIKLILKSKHLMKSVVEAALDYAMAKKKSPEIIDLIINSDFFKTPVDPFLSLSETIVFTNHYMSTSPIVTIIQKLHDYQPEIPLSEKSTIRRSLYKKAFGFQGWFNSEMEIKFDNYVKFFNNLPNESNNLYRAFSVLISNKEKDIMAIKNFMKLMADSSVACSARHMNTYYIILRYVGNLLVVPNHSSSESKYLTTLKESFLEFLDDFKQRAYLTSFIIPSEVALKSFYDGSENDVNVHGTNLYLCLLDRILGIKLPTLSYEDDESKGFYPFLEADKLGSQTFNSIKNYIEDENNFGKPFQYEKHRITIFFSNQYKNTFAGQNSGMKTRDICLSLNFSRPSILFFRKEFVLPRLWNYFENNGMRENSLQHIFTEMKSKGLLNDANDIDDINYYVMDEENDYKFSTDRFNKILKYVGISK